MEIIHRVTFNKVAGVDKELAELGIKSKKNELPGGYYILTFEIKESDSQWSKVKELLAKGAADFVVRVFTTDEILQADYSRLLVTKEVGYPYPENRWQQVKQDIFSGYCEECGVYTVQVGNFRIKNEFSENNNFVSMFWSAGAIFCSPEVLSGLNSHKFSGFQTKDVYIRDSDEISKFKQVEVSQMVKGKMKNKIVRFEGCIKCGVRKYNYIKNDYLSYKRANISDLDFQTTFEWFGSGKTAFKQIIISRRVAKAILGNKWKGIRLEPLLVE